MVWFVFVQGEGGGGCIVAGGVPGGPYVVQESTATVVYSGYEVRPSADCTSVSHSWAPELAASATSRLPWEGEWRNNTPCPAPQHRQIKESHRLAPGRHGRQAVATYPCPLVLVVAAYKMPSPAAAKTRAKQNPSKPVSTIGRLACYRHHAAGNAAAPPLRAPDSVSRMGAYTGDATGAAHLMHFTLTSVVLEKARHELGRLHGRGRRRRGGRPPRLGGHRQAYGAGHNV